MYTLKVKSSSSNETYTVTFELSETISIKCSCKAGLSKLLCKHRLDLLSGDIKALDANDVNVYREIMQSLDKDRVNNLLSLCDSIDEQIRQLEAQRKKIKKEIGIRLSDGF